MTNKEEKTIQDLLSAVAAMREENKMFREYQQELVGEINKKVEAKHLPVTFEQDILKVAQTSIGEAIKGVLTGYNSPLTGLVKSVVDENSAQLRKIISDSFSEVISLPEFKQSIVNAFSHKVARTIISNNDGLFDKVSNDLKGDQIFKSKMSLAVANVVEECLRGKENA